MKSFKMRQNNNGFTLMEVMAAFAILTISLLLLATFFLTATRMISRGNEIKDQGNDIFASAESGVYGSDVEAVLIENFSVPVKIKNGSLYQSSGTIKGYKNSNSEFVKSYIYVPTESELS